MNGVIAQRLCRMICAGCRTKYYPAEHVLHDAGIEEYAGRAFQKGGGCQRCHNSGFAGRVGIYEVMEVSPELRRMIHRAAPTHELRDKVRQHGGLSLREEGVAVAIQGKSSLEEVLRVTQNDQEVVAQDVADAA
jgi:type II secretory ATPase GspE/PulE/Tfp pilus assembly ATPase PilB-like protein